LKIYTAKSRQQPSKIEIHWTLPAATSQEDGNNCRRTIPPTSLSLFPSIHPLVLKTLGAASTGLSSALNRYRDPHFRLPKASPNASPKPINASPKRIQSESKASSNRGQGESKSEEAGKKTSQRQESCPLSNGLAAICGSSLFVSFQRISIQGISFCKPSGGEIRNATTLETLARQIKSLSFFLPDPLLRFR
jgi:hypothetical protein